MTTKKLLLLLLALATLNQQAMIASEAIQTETTTEGKNSAEALINSPEAIYYESPFTTSPKLLKHYDELVNQLETIKLPRKKARKLRVENSTSAATVFRSVMAPLFDRSLSPLVHVKAFRIARRSLLGKKKLYYDADTFRIRKSRAIRMLPKAQKKSIKLFMKKLDKAIKQSKKDRAELIKAIAKERSSLLKHKEVTLDIDSVLDQSASGITIQSPFAAYPALLKRYNDIAGRLAKESIAALETFQMLNEPFFETPAKAGEYKSAMRVAGRRMFASFSFYKRHNDFRLLSSQMKRELTRYAIQLRAAVRSVLKGQKEKRAALKKLQSFAKKQARIQEKAAKQKAAAAEVQEQIVETSSEAESVASES